MANYLYKGVDLSVWNGKVDFKALKAGGYDFVILRAGYGKVATQKDKRFEEYYKLAKEAGLEVGCYWFSYANTVSDGLLEAKVFLQCIKGKTFTFPCYYDIEDPKTSLKNGVSKATLTNMANSWCKEVEKAGYKAGIYTSYSAAINRFNINEIPYEKWLAKWSTNMGNFTTDDWGLWQHAVVGNTNESTIPGNIPGTNKNTATDENYAYKDYPKIIGSSFNESPNIPTVTPKKSVEEIAKEVWKGLWGNGNERKRKLTEAGYNYDEIQKMVQKIDPNKNKPSNKKSVKEIAKEVWKGLWGNGNERKKKLEAAGYNYDEVQKAVNSINKPVHPPAITKGLKVNFSNVKLYATATTNKVANTISGNYFVYSDEKINNRIRVTSSSSYVGKTPSGKYVTGWVNSSDIK